MKKIFCPSCFNNFKHSEIKSIVPKMVICPKCKRRIKIAAKICKKVYVRIMPTIRMTNVKMQKPTGYLWGSVDHTGAMANKSMIVNKYVPYFNKNLKLNRNMFMPKATKI